MCGIVGAIAERNIVPILMEGLRRLEYRGYDSAGIAVLNGTRELKPRAHRRQGQDAAGRARRRPDARQLGIAHTRWATHGVPSRAQRASAHLARRPRDRSQRHHRESRGAARRAEAQARLQVHVGDRHRSDRASHSLSPEARTTCSRPCVPRSRSSKAPTRSPWSAKMIPRRSSLAREGCPVVIGLGVDENFVASDVAALLPVTRRFMFLEEGDVAEIRRRRVRILDRKATPRAPGAARASCPPTPPRRASTATSCSRKSTSSRARSRDTLQSAWPNGRCSKPPSARPRPKCSSAPSTCTSSRAAPAITRAPSRSTHRADLQAAVLRSRSRASIAIAIRSCRRTRCSSRSRSPAKPPTRSPRCAWRSNPVICRACRSATCRKARWCANPSSCC